MTFQMRSLSTLDNIYEGIALGTSEKQHGHSRVMIKIDTCMCKTSRPKTAGGAGCRTDVAIERRHVAASVDAAAGAVQEGGGP